MLERITKEYLINTFKIAKENNKSICVELTIPGQNDTEYIINKNESIDNKLQYYLNTYNDKLEHNRNSLVRIVNAFAVDMEVGSKITESETREQLRKKLIDNIVKERMK